MLTQRSTLTEVSFPFYSFLMFGAAGILFSSLISLVLAATKVTPQDWQAVVSLVGQIAIQSTLLFFLLHWGIQSLAPKHAQAGSETNQ